MADVLWLVKPKLSTVLCCGAVMVVSSLSLSLILVSYLMDGADEQKTAKLARWDGGYRNILDVHSVDVDRPADANYGVNEDQEAKKRSKHCTLCTARGLLAFCNCFVGVS